MKRIILSLGLLLALLVSCQKHIEESRYYVKYTGMTSTVHMVNTSYTYTTDSGKDTYTVTGFGSDYSVTIGPVTKGFQAEISCSIVGESEYGVKSRRVTIEVSKDNDPFALKASGTNYASYTIDY